ncbi:MAG: 50S ribosomal protein L30 [Sulfuricaulis sp.]
MAKKKIRITLLHSFYGTGKKHMATIRGLGLRRQRHSVELEDTAAVRGMINRVSYLVKYEEI